MMSPVTQVPDLARILAAETWRTATGMVRRMRPAGRLTAPRSFAYVPEALREPDPERARRIYQGEYTFSGVTVTPGTRSPFQAKDAPVAWRRELAAFEWLADLAHSDSELARVQARYLIADWIATDSRKRGPGWETGIVARRLISWLRCAPFFMANSSADFHTRIMASIGRQVRWLMGGLGTGPRTFATLHGAIALSYTIACTTGMERMSERAAAVLTQALRDQLHPDGGHISRNPARTVDLLELLLPLRACIADRELEPPDGLLSAIDRLVPLLKLFLHGDRGLAFFNGASETRRRLIAALLAGDTPPAKPLQNARQSGYSRLAQGKTVIIADTGKALSGCPDGSGHAGALSFEFSHAAQRIVINCGSCPQGPDEWRAAARTTAAHSTLAIADRSSAWTWNMPMLAGLTGGPLSFGPEHVSAEIKLSDAGELLSAEHDGYAPAFGLAHHREIYLSRNGLDIRGEDRLIPRGQAEAGKGPASHPFAIRFHLHPSIKATLSKDNGSALLLLPDRSGWRFSARGALMKLEESVYFVDRAVPHRTLQIILFAETSRTLQVQWAFKKIDKTSEPSRRDRPSTTHLPLKGGRMN